MGLFGIGDGKMDLQVANLNVASGQTLTGTATLTLNKDIKGKQVVATLYAERTEVTNMRMNNRNQPTRRNIQIYKKTEVLDTEKLYAKAGSPYKYKFDFVIPQTGASTSKAAGEVVSGLLTVASALGSVMNNTGPTRWYVKVELDHEGILSFPIAKTQEINIVVQTQTPESEGPVV